MTFSLSRLAVLGTAALLLAACGTTNEDRSQTAEKLYADAQEEMESGGYDRAIKSFERVEGLAAGTLMAQQAQLNIAWLHWKTNEKAQALSTVDRFIRLNPSSPALDYALYLKGLINFNEETGIISRLAGQDLSERDQRAARDAWQAFKQLADQFPQSSYTPDAEARMAYIVDSLANYEVHVARYYLNRGAWLAAANRAQQAVTEFQGTPAVEEALYILTQAYDRLQLPALRDDAERVLRQNYPESRFIADGNARSRPWWKLF